jgi:hypothetical protein
MKRSEWIIVAVVGIIAAFISIIVSGALFGSPQKNPIKVPVVQKITADFPTPQTDDSYKDFFNSKAFDPTQIIQIGNGNNSTPFQAGPGQ